jgi:hypothetical protein
MLGLLDKKSPENNAVIAEELDVGAMTRVKLSTGRNLREPILGGKHR